MNDGQAPAKSTTPMWRTPIGVSQDADDPRRAAHVDAVAASVAKMTPAQLMERRYMRYQWPMGAK